MHSGRSGFHTPIGIWVWLVQSDIVYADRALAKYFGIGERDASQGVPIRGYLAAIHPADRGRISASIEATALQGGRFNEAYRVKAIDGSWHNVIAAGHCFLEENGSPSLFAGWLTDISEIASGKNQGLSQISHMVRKARAWSENPAVRYVLDDVLASIDALGRTN